VCQAYGLRHEKTGYGQKRIGVERTTFIIDGPGVVERVFAKAKVAAYVDALRETVTAIAKRNGAP
jgi:peroxiredoxin